jgi:hypothetical protein
MFAFQVRDNLRGPYTALVEACEVTAGMGTVFPLNEAEISALWPLVVVRAINLVASVEHLVKLDPTNTYNVDERALDWLIFDRVSAIPFPLAEAALRHAASMPPSAATHAAVNWISQLKVCGPAAGSPSAAATSAKLIGVPIDMSITSESLRDGNWWQHSLDSGIQRGVTDAIADMVQQQQASHGNATLVAIGRWGEARLT